MPRARAIVVGAGSPNASATTTIKSLAMVFAAIESSHTGKRVKVRAL